MKFEWDPKLNTGIDDIDEQHKKMFETIFSLNNENLSGGKKTEILNNLRDYVLEHFETEEAYMQKYEYPYYKQHKALHERFTTDYNNLLLKLLEELSLDSMKLYFVDLLNSWLMAHYRDADVKLALFLREKIKDEFKE
jgi:hemerythrin